MLWLLRELPRDRNLAVFMEADFLRGYLLTIFWQVCNYPWWTSNFAQRVIFLQELSLFDVVRIGAMQS